LTQVIDSLQEHDAEDTQKRHQLVVGEITQIAFCLEGWN